MSLINPNRDQNKGMETENETFNVSPESWKKPYFQCNSYQKLLQQTPKKKKNTPKTACVKIKMFKAVWGLKSHCNLFSHAAFRTNQDQPLPVW